MIGATLQWQARLTAAKRCLGGVRTVKPTQSEEASREVRPTDALRRRLLRGGLAAAPVLMTVASRPAMANTCTTMSHSMSASSRNTTMHTCSGGDCDYWESKLSGTSTSTSAYYMESTATASSADTTPLFGSVFGTGDFSDMTFLQVLQANTGLKDMADLAAHLVAAVLNAQHNLTPDTVLGVGLAQEIWHSFSARSYFEPTAGVQWDIPQTIEWMLTTMPQRG